MKELMVQGKAVNVAELPNIRQFLAAKAGITLPPTVKGTPGLTTKEVVALCEGAGRTKDQIKADRGELDTLRKQHYVQSAMVVAMLAADPSLRKSVRVAHNAKGEAIGANITVRKERSASVTGAVRIATLEKQLADALAKLAALPALPA